MTEFRRNRREVTRQRGAQADKKASRRTRRLVARCVVLRWLAVTARAEACCPAPRSASTLLRSCSAAADQPSVKRGGCLSRGWRTLRLPASSCTRWLVARCAVLRWLAVTARAEACCPAPRSASTLLRSCSAVADQPSVMRSVWLEPRWSLRRCASQRRVARDCWSAAEPCCAG